MAAAHFCLPPHAVTGGCGGPDLELQHFTRGQADVEVIFLFQECRYRRVEVIAASSQIVFYTVAGFIVLGAFLVALYQRFKLKHEIKIREQYENSVASMRHDIRNPLNVILNVFEQSLHYSGDKSSRNFLYTALDEIDEILESATSIRPKKIQDYRGVHEGTDLINELIYAKNKYQKYSSSIIEFENKSALKEVWFEIPRSKLQRLINNIIENAVRNSEYTKIITSYDSHANYFSVSFKNLSDNDVIKYVEFINSKNFDLPYCGKSQSSGLGGWIMKSISYDFNIHISASYNDAIISIDLRFPVSSDKVVLENDLMACAQSSTPLESCNWLIVDDSYFNAQLAKHHITDLGHKAHWVQSYDLLVDLMGNGSDKFDYFLIDFNLGDERNGIDVFEYLIENFMVKPDRVMIFTGEALDIDQRRRFYGLGGVFIFRKPISLSVIADVAGGV